MTCSPESNSADEIRGGDGDDILGGFAASGDLLLGGTGDDVDIGLGRCGHHSWLAAGDDLVQDSDYFGIGDSYCPSPSGSQTTCLAALATTRSWGGLGSDHLDGGSGDDFLCTAWTPLTS